MLLFAAVTCRRRGVGYQPLAFCYLANLLTCTLRFPYLILYLLLITVTQESNLTERQLHPDTRYNISVRRIQLKVKVEYKKCNVGQNTRQEGTTYYSLIPPTTEIGAYTTKTTTS